MITDYFTAASDEAAVGVLENGPAAAGLDTVHLKSIDPVNQLSVLDGVLTGRPYIEFLADPRAGKTLADNGSGEKLVLTVTEPLQKALTLVVGDQVHTVAINWAQAPESETGGWMGTDLQPAVRDLAGLASRASAVGHHLYCWRRLEK